MVKVAVHVVPPLPAVQVAAAPSAALPFMNCTVPLGAATFIEAAVTVAVRVTLPPDAMDVALDETDVVVVTLLTTFTATAADVDEA